MQARSDHMNVLQKTAVFENQLTQEQRTLKLQLCYVGPQQQVNLTLSLKISNAQRIINNSQLFYLDHSARVCQFVGNYPFHDDLFIEIDPKLKHKPHFRFRKMGGPTATISQPPEVKESSTPGPRKSGERTIAEVRQYVQHKNQICRNMSQGGQNCTIQQAADIIGLPKKTLDDYERHLRLAELYGFDFERYKHVGMGVLRNFVKQRKEPQLKQEFMEPGYFLNSSRH